jgi:hypothetical protein
MLNNIFPKSFSVENLCLERIIFLAQNMFCQLAYLTTKRREDIQKNYECLMPFIFHLKELTITLY